MQRPKGGAGWPAEGTAGAGTEGGWQVLGSKDLSGQRHCDTRGSSAIRARLLIGTPSWPGHPALPGKQNMRRTVVPS